jgi:hypothetical protein
MGAASQYSARLDGSEPKVSKIRLVLAFCKAKPNCMPIKPKLMFQICQKLRRGRAIDVEDIDQLMNGTFTML